MDETSPGWFKINCDAAIDGKNGVMGGGLIIRDSAEKPFAVRSFTKRGCLDSTTAEAMVVVQAAHFCKEMGVNNVIVEGDASTIITALRET
jgi:ribonuclease HI